MVSGGDICLFIFGSVFEVDRPRSQLWFVKTCWFYRGSAMLVVSCSVE